MPAATTYPGVYIEEVPSAVRTIVGVSTSKTAFVGRALRGPVNDPVEIHGFGDFERVFGGLWKKSPMSYAVQQYFLNGGSTAIIVRVVHKDDSEGESEGDSEDSATAATITVGSLELKAANEGEWGNELRARVDHEVREDPDATPETIFNLFVKDGTTGSTEEFRNVSVEKDHARYVGKILEQESALVRMADPKSPPATRPNKNDPPAAGEDLFGDSTSEGADADSGSDGSKITPTDAQGSENGKEGIYALKKTDIFNLLCIPPLDPDTDVLDAGGGSTLMEKALALCEDERAILLVDPPESWSSAKTVVDTGYGEISSLYHKNAAIYFPKIKAQDPEREYRLESFAPCGAVAGIIARTDVSRGIWKAPAGQETTVIGARSLSVDLTNEEQGTLNPLGVNCLRRFPDSGYVVWGARTLRGSDRLASQWKYLPIRRLALHIEESLFRGTQWVVFEPNDEPLWSQIRLNVGTFMHGLFRQGAFQGKSPKEAYFVKCDAETTPQADRDRGIVNIHVGFAPLKPAEFVVIKISQMAGQLEV